MILVPCLAGNINPVPNSRTSAALKHYQPNDFKDVFRHNGFSGPV
jgi:hypothetical protein